MNTLLLRVFTKVRETSLIHLKIHLSIGLQLWEHFFPTCHSRRGQLQSCHRPPASVCISHVESSTLGFSGGGSSSSRNRRNRRAVDDPEKTQESRGPSHQQRDADGKRCCMEVRHLENCSWFCWLSLNVPSMELLPWQSGLGESFKAFAESSLPT